jgi:undecaprenyl-diphosphatase
MKKIFGLCVSLGMIMSFVLWTILVSVVDLQSIGPRGSFVGFATINGWLKNIIGVNFILYEITDWLGIIPIIVVLGFAIVGLVQLIKRKSLLKVDRSILLLGVFYIVVASVYVLFEVIVINYRPVLIGGRLETSYPSSTTMLIICVMLTALLPIKVYIKNKTAYKIIKYVTWDFVIFMILGRILSGVHWISDIVGGILISGGLVVAYYTLCSKHETR